MYTDPILKRISILGVPVDPLSRAEAVAKIAAFAEGEGQHFVVTPNPEMVVEAQKNQSFKDVLQKADVALADGAGLLWAAKRQGNKLPERVTGTDVMQDLCMRADLPPIFLLGAALGVAEHAAQILRGKNPALNIMGTFAGSPKPEDDADIINRVNESEARILFVAYGAPAQELWIHRNLSKMPNVKVAMGIGGAFDFITGKRSRAPSWMRSLHIEWLWRLLQQPSRIGRIANATIVFPWLVLTKR